MSIYEEDPDTGMPRYLALPELGDLYFGPPVDDSNNRRCTYESGRGYCPNRISFYVKVPDGRTDWRKGWASCYDHLAGVIVQMRYAYGGWEGGYVLVMEPPVPGSGELVR